MLCKCGGGLTFDHGFSMKMPNKGTTQLDTSWCEKAPKKDVGEGFGSESHVHGLVSHPEEMQAQLGFVKRHSSCCA